MTNEPGTKSSPRPASTSGRGLAFAILLFSGLVFGWFANLILVVKPSPLYPVHFTDDSEWITLAGSHPNACFRYDLNIEDVVDQAWIQISAPDFYGVTVNGLSVGSLLATSVSVSGNYDLTGVLKKGDNVIAITLGRLSFPGSAEVRAEIFYRTRDGQWRVAGTDRNWRVSPVPERLADGVDWTMSAFDVKGWEKASVVPPAAPHNPPKEVALDSRLLMERPSAAWIGPADHARESVRFSGTFDWDPASQNEVWLQLGAAGSFDLELNGVVVARQTSSTVGILIYRITPWARKGTNRLAVTVTPQTGEGTLFAEVLATSANEVARLGGTDETWRTGTPSKPAAVLGWYGDTSWGVLKRTLAVCGDLAPLRTEAFLKGLGTVLGSGVFMVPAAWAWSAIVGFLRRLPRGAAFPLVALLSSPAGLFLLWIWFLGFDIRLPLLWSFEPIHLLIALLILILSWSTALIVGRFDATHEPDLPGVPKLENRMHRILFFAALLLLAGVGLSIRLHDLAYISFDHDEMNLIQKAINLPEKGYPFSTAGTFMKPLSTYESVPYVQAAFGLMLGWSEWTLRLPNVIFGTLTILLIGTVGRRMFHWQIGLMTAVVYTFLPYTIRWSQNAFYPQQAQTFTLLAFWCFYEAVRDPGKVNAKWLYGASAATLLTYFSWEGSGFLLPALALGLVAVRGADFTWLKSPPLWGSLYVMGCIILSQQCFRKLTVDPYLIVGSGLSNVTTPSLYFLDPLYDPNYYINQFLLVEHQVPLTIALSLGVIFHFRDKALRYVAVIVFTVVIAYTNFLSAVAARYTVFACGALVLGGCAAAWYLMRDFVVLARKWTGLPVDLVRAISAALFIGLFFTATQPFFVKSFRLSSNSGSPVLLSRFGVYRIDYRGAANYVAAHYQPGDVVIPAISHIFEYYSGLPSQYAINTLLVQNMIYDSLQGQPIYVDRFSGNVSIKTLQELDEVLSKSGRAWIVLAPASRFGALNAPGVVSYIENKGKVVFQSYDSEVILFERHGGEPAIKPWRELQETDARKTEVPSRDRKAMKNR